MSAATTAPVTIEAHTPWWKQPRTLIGIVVAAGILYLLFRLSVRPLRFQTDVLPDGELAWDWAFVWSLVPDLLNALSVTAANAIFGFIVAAILGFFLALARRSSVRVLRWPTALFIEFVRSTPLLVQLYFWFFALPSLGVTLSSNQALVIALGIHYATYCSEAYRAGINSVPEGQWEACTALNLGSGTKWRNVIAPQAIPNVLPALANFQIAAFKDAPLGSAINVLGLLFFAQTITGRFFRPVEPFLMIGAGFLMISVPAAWLLRRLERRISYERI